LESLRNFPSFYPSIGHWRPSASGLFESAKAARSGFGRGAGRRWPASSPCVTRAHLRDAGFRGDLLGLPGIMRGLSSKEHGE